MIVLVILLAMTTFVSFAKFNVANPFAVANGLFQIAFTDNQYVEIQAYPKAILAKPGTSLKDYMESMGFIENTEEQLGALRVFEQAESKEYVFHFANKYFAEWHWNE